MSGEVVRRLKNCGRKQIQEELGGVQGGGKKSGCNQTIMDVSQLTRVGLIFGLLEGRYIDTLVIEF